MRRFALRDPLVAALAGVTRPGNIGSAIAGGKLTAGDLDRMVFYNLVPYFRLGIFDSPSKGARGRGCIHAGARGAGPAGGRGRRGLAEEPQRRTAD